MARETINIDDLLLRWFQVDDFHYDSSWIDEIESLRKILKFIPFLEQVGVCNSIPMGVSSKDSDIDLFVVTKPNRVYLVRLWMVVLFHILGKRRHGDQVKGRFCLSFFVDNGNLDMTTLRIKDDYYLDNWIKQIWWLLDNEEVLSKWCSLNDLKFKQVLFEWGYQSRLGMNWFFDRLNFLVGVIQRLVAHKKYKRKNFPKGVVFEEGIIKCHDQDIRWEFRDFIETSFSK